jgi:uncharacterized protein YdhG (YjbR/CyaY superfamily)
VPSARTNAAVEARTKVRRYIDALQPSARKGVKRLRQAIRAAAPGATDAFSYGIPAFRLDGHILLWYAGWKQHTSIYPLTAAMKRTHARELKGYAMSKGTLRLPLAEATPTALIKRLVKTRIAELRSARRR